MSLSWRRSLKRTPDDRNNSVVEQRRQRIDPGSTQRRNNAGGKGRDEDYRGAAKQSGGVDRTNSVKEKTGDVGQCHDGHHATGEPHDHQPHAVPDDATQDLVDLGDHQ